MGYKDTLNLPQTTFSMKANLVKREPLIRAQWDKINIYGKIRRKYRGAPKYILHDGPPYANGEVHIGTVLNKILKDIVVKFKTMQGFDAPFIPGWDCHGLPIEHRVMNQLGAQAQTMSKADIRKECEKYALKFVEIQKRQFKSLGVLGDWDKPYLTLDPSYEAAVIEVFTDLVDKGYVYRKLKPIHWCMRCATALAEAELVYADAKGPSIYVKFPILKSESIAKAFNLPPSDLQLPTSFFIWTTTPWTLPGNVAVAFNPSFDYALVKAKNPKTGNREILIFAEGLVQSVMEIIGIKDYKVIGKTRGSELERLTYQHPFLPRTGQVILANYVRLEDGTGCVHIAPGHGIEDYESGLKYKLPVLSPVDEHGNFTKEAGVFEGINVFTADDKICQLLVDKGCLMKRVDVVHSYPHCWRCKNPVIFRATEQWFISVDHNQARERALAEAERVRWVPDWGKVRITSMLRERPDWCISRQRTWGVPIPVFYCRQCHAPLLKKNILERVRKIFRREGALSWFNKPESDFIPTKTKCECGNTQFVKGNDIFDVWFESGSSFRAVVIEHKQLSFPSDLYLEGTDQHRGWFQLSLLPSVMSRNQTPFKAVLTHGFVTDEEGEKVSKSKGGLLMADEIVSRVGADIARLWISSINFTDDIPVSIKILQERSEPYRKIRNTFRYLLGNLYDFDPVKDRIAYQDLWEIDKWTLNKLHRLINTTTQAYESFEFYRVFRALYEFCVTEMSAFYLDILKDRIYTFARNSRARRAAQTTMYNILVNLTKMIAPILAYTAEEIWPLIPGKHEAESVHLADWPEADKDLISDEIETRWQKLIKIRTDVARELEKLRKAKKIGSSLEAEVSLFAEDKKLVELLKQYEPDLPMVFITSKVSLSDTIPPDVVQGVEVPGLCISVTPSNHQKCERCWNYLESVGKTKEHPTLCERCVKVITTEM